MGDASPGGVLHRSNAGCVGSVAGGGPPGVGRVEEYGASYLWSAAHHAYFPPGGVDGVVVVPAETCPVEDVGFSVVLPRDYVVNFAPRRRSLDSLGSSLSRPLHSRRRERR